MTLRLKMVSFALGLASIAASAAAASNPPPATGPAFDRASWLADYAGLKQALANGYANIDWQVDRRNFSLVSADAAITGMLEHAQSDVEAALVFARLIEAFDDPHLQLSYGPAPATASLLPRQSQHAPTSAASLCDPTIYRPIKPATRLAYARAADWVPLSDGPFLAGRIGATGFIRIPAFGEERFPEACAKVAKPGLSGRALQLAIRSQLNRDIDHLIRQMKAGGVTRMVFDISGNGGGTEWSESVASMLTAGRLSRTKPRLAAPTCERSSMWQGERPCPIYSGDPVQEEFAGSGAWTGPLAVFVDSRSASAAEEFVTLLMDSKRAVIVGQRTFGSGCGYIDGGHAFTFKTVPMHVMMPNCSRYTAAGINEIEGITPTIAVDWPTLDPKAVPALLDRVFEAAP